MRAILTFQGFTESNAKRTGTEDLYWRVIRGFSGGDITSAWPVPWTEDVGKMAKLIARQGVRSVALASYSHGQAAACDFAEECYKLGIDVDLWLACDPVYRPAWLPRLNSLQPLAFRAMTDNRKIKVPRNIKRVASVYQRVNRPHGHELVATSPDTTIMPPLKIDLGHTDIDHAGAWYALVERELTIWKDTV